jgi:rSAM/selenodomain-associated transferase 1
VNERTRVIVMAKAPEPGQAKTRLIPALGAQGAARLAARLLERAVDAAIDSGISEVVLACAPDTAHAAFAAQARRGVSVRAQGEGDLGLRMRRAFDEAFAAGATHAVLVGTDVPSLDAGTLRRARAALATADAVFVPAFDGGYALIGLRRIEPLLFEGLPWSSAAVMALTRERLAAAGLSHVELPPVHDIDEPTDLQHLPPGWLQALTASRDS